MQNSTMPTVHIEAKFQHEIADTVLMPGDPLKAKLIAETYLKDFKIFNKIRNILGYTGTYKNRKISVMASGMGIPSMGIYSYELFNFYDVKNIIRIGSCGSYLNTLNDIGLILCEDVYSESSYARIQSNSTDRILKASSTLNEKITISAQKLGINLTKGRVHSCDVFYIQNPKYHTDIINNHKCIAVEMESFSLFANSKLLNRDATTLLIVSDNMISGVGVTVDQIQKSFISMVTTALESVLL